MKKKKILAVIAASAMALSLTGLSAFAAGQEDDSKEIGEEDVEVLDEEDEDVEEFEDEEFEDEDFEDEDFEDEDFDEEDFEDEDFEDEEFEEEDEEDSTDDIVVVEDSTTEVPKTGNAPIALAVIPVALAAAAVIAKKAK